MEVSPSSYVVNISMSTASSMENSTFSSARAFSLSGFESESEYGKLRIFVSLGVGCYVCLSKTSFLFTLLVFELDPGSFDGGGVIALLFFKLL